MRGRLGHGAPYGGHAPGVTCAIVTHGLQLVLWTPWPQALQYTSMRRYCVNGVGYRSNLHMCRPPDTRPSQCSMPTQSAVGGYKILSQDEGHVPGFHGDSWDRKTDADRALVWLPRATGMVQIYRAVPSGPNLNCAGRVAPEKLAAGMQRPREVQVPEHGCVRCGTELDGRGYRFWRT